MKIFSLYTLFAVCAIAPLTSEWIEVRTPSGKCCSFEIESEQPFNEVMDQIQSYLVQEEQSNEESTEKLILRPMCVMDFMSGKMAGVQENGSRRDYLEVVTGDERSDIRYIVTNLATNSWTKLLRNKSSLERAGDRIEHIHPLRFLGCIFSDEELKAGLCSIRERKQVWKEFSSSLFATLDEESRYKNLKIEYIQDFAQALHVDIDAILPSIENRQWSSLITTLLRLLPRQDNPNRYDM